MQYLLDRAQKGFSLQGVFIKELNIFAAEEGKNSKDGVDVSFEFGVVPTAGGATTSPSLVGGERKSEGARLKLRYVYPIVDKNNNLWRPGVEMMMQRVNEMVHEPFIHGELMERRFYADYDQPFLYDRDHDDKLFKSTTYGQFGLSMLTVAMNRYLEGTAIKKVSQQNLQLMIDIGREVNLKDKYNLSNRAGIEEYIQKTR